MKLLITIIMRGLFLFLLLQTLCSKTSKGDDVTTRLIYDTMAQLVGDPIFPDEW